MSASRFSPAEAADHDRVSAGYTRIIEVVRRGGPYLWPYEAIDAWQAYNGCGPLPSDDATLVAALRPHYTQRAA